MIFRVSLRISATVLILGPLVSLYAHVNASIQGEVSYQNGAVISAAAITVGREAIGIDRKVTTDAGGIDQIGEQKRALVIYSSREDAPYTALIESACRRTLSDGLAGRLDYYSEYLDLARFSSPGYQEALRDFLQRKYAGRPMDVIIAEGNAPFEFMERYGPEIFPGAPVVFSIEERDLSPRSNSTGLVFQIDMQSTLGLALKLQPNIKRVFVVTGTSDFDKFYNQMAHQQFKEYEGRVTFTYLTPMPLKDLLEEVRRIPEDSIIYFVSLFEDGGGEKFIPVDVLDKLTPVASAPVYCWPEMTIDHGIVGGNLLSEENVAEQTAGLALRVLRGENPDRIPVAKIRPYVNIFDWRQLRRWGISEDRLPAGSLVRFKELTTWERYRGRILLAAGLIILQTFLISGLLIERRRKKRAAQTLVESEDRFARAFKSNPQPMSITTFSDGRYVDVNESFVRMSGFTAEELIGRTSVELNIYESQAHREAVLLRPLKNGSVRNLEMTFRKKDGSSRVLLSSYELLDLRGEKCILVASSDITERKESEQRLAELTGRLLRTQDEERRRIARELHDVTAQSIGLMILNLTQVKAAASSLGDRAMEKLSESLSFGEQALKDIRTLSYILHPPLLDQSGLQTALKWYIKGFSDRSGVKVTFTEDGSNGHRMPPEVEYALFRIVQESLTNIRRHTNSETAEISLKNTPDEVLLSIRDEGRGLKLNLPRNGDGIESLGVGIPGMRHRLKQLGGDLLVDSNPNGTTITATVPVRWVV